MSLLTFYAMSEPSPSFGKEESGDFIPLSGGGESSISDVSRELVEAHIYLGQDVAHEEFTKIDPYIEMSWMSSLDDVPIAFDKFDSRSKDVSFYRRNSELVQIVKIRDCTLIFFIKDNIIEGSVILTKRGMKGIEIEYAKNRKVQKDGIAKDMIFTVLTNYYVFDLEGKVSELYGEVVPHEGSFNFGSYITLIRAGFVPIRRLDGDGIRFVFPNTSLDETLIIHDILVAYDNYQKSSKEYLKVQTHRKSEIQSIALGILGGDPIVSVAGKEESMLEEKRAMAKLFEMACLKCSH